MRNEKIKSIAENLIEMSNQDIAFFEIDEYGGANDECYINANQDGLILYAAELLYAAIVDNESKTWGINRGEPWLKDNKFQIDYVQLSTASRQEITPQDELSGLKRKLGDYGCTLVFILAIVTFFIGLGTIIKMAFNFLAQ